MPAVDLTHRLTKTRGRSGLVVSPRHAFEQRMLGPDSRVLLELVNQTTPVFALTPSIGSQSQTGWGS